MTSCTSPVWPSRSGFIDGSETDSVFSLAVDTSSEDTIRLQSSESQSEN